MLSQDDRTLVADDILAYLEVHLNKDMLRLLTCGSVDDGKSTLIGRLLFDSKQIHEDQLASLESDSEKMGTTGGDIDYALLLDGLKAEREQGITIDVAYRFFSTTKRKFIIADTPGHEQYTRNMATGASTCDLAILLVDARHGVLVQTKRHSFIVSQLGIKHAVVAINKMDLVDYSEERFEQIRADYVDFAAKLDIFDVHFIPISALKGDNVVERSSAMAWYQGSTLMNLLETVHIASDGNLIDFRLPVQYVKRPHLNFRGFAGTIASGTVRICDEVASLPSGKRSVVKEVFVHGDATDKASVGMAATITLEDEIDISRGDMLCSVGNLPHLSRELDALLVWMHEDGMRPGGSYLLKSAAAGMPCVVEDLQYRMDVNTLHRDKDCEALALNDIGRVQISLTRPLAFDSYRRNRQTGAFILIDRNTNATVAAGMILDRGDTAGRQALDRQAMVAERQSSQVTAQQRQSLLGHKSACVWLTGLPKAGKTSIAYALEKCLVESGVHAAVLDSRRLRSDLNSDLGYSTSDRSENVRRLACLAAHMRDCGMVSIVSAVSPQLADRQAAFDRIGSEACVEIHVAAELEACIQRDDEGVYAENGPHRKHDELLALYQAPVDPVISISAEQSIEQAVDAIISVLAKRGLLPNNRGARWRF